MVEEGKLAFENASPQQMCLVAITYHNLAIVQLQLEAPDLACKSSQNARKISKLCISYSNRWLSTFQRTHEIVLEDLKYMVATTTNKTSEEMELLRRLIDDMFDPQ